MLYDHQKFRKIIFLYSVGSLGKYDNETDVKGIIVKDCTLVGTQNGLRIKTYEGKSASRASSMIFQDIVMKDVKHPIIIDQFYGGKDKVHFPQHILL